MSPFIPSTGCETLETPRKLVLLPTTTNGNKGTSPFNLRCGRVADPAVAPTRGHRQRRACTAKKNRRCPLSFFHLRVSFASGIFDSPVSRSCQLLLSDQFGLTLLAPVQSTLSST